MASVMWLLEEREVTARAVVEELQAEADRILAELGAAEAVLERRVIARTELAEALAAGGDSTEKPAPKTQAPQPPAAPEPKAMAAGAVVPRHGKGTTAQVLAPDYRRIVELVELESGDGEGISAKEIAAGLGLELVPAKIEGVRSKAKRLAGRGWLTASPTGRFTPLEPTATAHSVAGTRRGRGGGS